MMTIRFRLGLNVLFVACLFAAPMWIVSTASAAETSAVDVLPSDRILYCQPGTPLRLSGSCPLSAWTGEARLEIDRHVAARDSGGAMDGPYDFTWTAPDAGYYIVEVTYSLSSGARVVVRHFALHVLDTPPLDWQDSPRDEDNDFPVTLIRAPLKEFRIIRSYVLVDDQPLAVDPLDFTATIPGGSLGDGVHRASIEAFDHNGGRYVSSPVEFGVPPRIVMTSPGSLVVRTEGATVPLRAKVSPLWRPANITYYVNDVPVASADHAPFVAHADLRAYDSGNYELSAMAVDEDGNMTSARPVSVAIINIPRERAEEVREQAMEKSTDRIVPMPVPETTRPTPSSYPSGSAVVHGVGAGLTSDGTELIGLPVTVQARIRQGNRRTDLTGIVDDTASSAALAAAAWLRQQPGTGDGSHWDVMLSVEDSNAQHGDPDGITDALALSAALTGKTVDRSIVAIGNVVEDGELVPVGNMISKADYALSRAGVETLIVPNCPATSEELSVLSKMKPSLFQGKRVVTAQTMADVLRIVFSGAARVTAPVLTPHVLSPVARPARGIGPLPALMPSSTAAAPERPRTAAPAPPSDEDPLNTQLDQWQRLYEKNAGSLNSLATHLLHMMGGKD